MAERGGPEAEAVLAPQERPRRRPGGARPDGPLLERSQIVEAALALTRRFGLDGMSMRKLGTELGVTSMAIYWYFKGKDELVDAILEYVFAEVPLPDDASRAWDERLRALSWAVHDVLIEYPGVADQLYTYQNYPASAVPLVEYGIQALRDAGFDEVAAAQAFDVLASVVVTRSHFEAFQRLVIDREPANSVEERILEGWGRLNGAIDSSVPNTRSYVEHLDATGQTPKVFEQALEVVLAGLATTLPS